jgi:hypothetical protein
VLGTVPRVLIALGVVAAAATATGCGDSAAKVDKTQACTSIQQEFQNLLQAGIAQREDPQALSGTLRSSATKIRDQGSAAEGDLGQATGEVATALEQLADRLRTGTPQQSDLDTLVESGTKIGEACGPEQTR